ncbi:hypothetical protein IWQ55_006585 [Labrenzia sp. EL_208]|nr:hypothetical protein [Labrenzia sp. EL_132]MBG6233343.1 hypothetical protein [Labrenzia sp. EL_208]
MRKIFVSLGGACDAAQNLKKLGLRIDPYPFDWLWNLDNGLRDVSRMISSNFSDVTEKEDYLYSSHKFLKGDSVILFRCYRNIAHLHSNPIENDVERKEFTARVERFRELLNNKNDLIVFTYYRQIDVLRDLYGCDTQDQLTLLHKEAEEFTTLLQKSYCKLNFKFMGFLAVPSSVFYDKSSHQELDKCLVSNKNCLTSFGIVPIRDDETKKTHLRWQTEWRKSLRKTGFVTMNDLVRGKFRQKKNQFLNRNRRLRAALSVRLASVSKKLHFSTEPKN